MPAIQIYRLQSSSSCSPHRCLQASPASFCLLSEFATKPGQVPREVEEFRLAGLEALQKRSPSLDQITLDMESLAISKADTKVGETPIKMVVMGDAYLQRDKTDKSNRFVCLISDNGKVVLTFFTEQ